MDRSYEITEGIISQASIVFAFGVVVIYNSRIMPPEAKVLIVEDHPTYRKVFSQELSYEGHTTTGMIAHVSEAEAAIHGFKESGVVFDVALIDGNLGESRDGEDGARVVQMFRSEYPDTKLIGISASRHGVVGVDLNLNKSVMSFEDLVNAVTNI